MDTHTHTYIHTYVHTYIHTCIDTYIHTLHDMYWCTCHVYVKVFLHIGTWIAIYKFDMQNVLV